MRVIDFLELRLLKGFRGLLVLAVWVAVLIGIAYVIWTVTSSRAVDAVTPITKPAVSGSFTPPSEDPIDAARYAENLAAAKKSFLSRQEDACRQLDLRSREARKAKREIDSRYEEKLDATEDVRERSRIFDAQRAEYLSSCESANLANQAEINNLKRALEGVARERSVSASDISTDWEQNASQCIKYMDHCATYGSWTQDVSSLMSVALAGDYGCSGPATKGDIPPKVDFTHQYILNNFSQKDDQVALLGPILEYTRGASSYYVGKLDGLDMRNLLNDKNADLLATAMCEQWDGYVNETVNTYREYVQRRDSYVEPTAMDWGELLARLALLGPYALALLIGVLLLAFFSMERSQTRIGITTKVSENQEESADE